MTTLADNIKYYRKLNKLTQKDLANKLKIKPTAISAWELGRNKPLIGNIEKMATLFDISKSQLLGDDFEPNRGTIIMFAKNLKYLRQKHGVEQMQLAEYLGKKSSSSISSWESGIYTPKIKVLAQIANYFNVDLDNLMNVDLSLSQIGVEVAQKTIDIPVLGAIACEEPIDAEENISEYRSVPVDRVPGGDVFYLRAKGDSMEPKIPDGSYVLCRKQSDVENGEIVAVLVNGDEEATLKRVVKQGDIVLLQALNENYAPYILNADNPGKIVGKAIRMETEL